MMASPRKNYSRKWGGMQEGIRRRFADFPAPFPPLHLPPLWITLRPLQITLRPYGLLSGPCGISSGASSGTTGSLIPYTRVHSLVPSTFTAWLRFMDRNLTSS